MANNIQLITKFLPEMLDKVFAFESRTDAFLGDKGLKLNFLDNKTVKIPKLISTGLTKYNRGGSGATNTRGSLANQWETFTLTQERYSEIPLDKLDNEESGGFILGHQATEFTRTKTIPEIDTYRFSKLAGYTNEVMGNLANESISANTIISKFNTAFKWFAEHGVQEQDQIIYVNPSIMELIRSTSELYRKLSQSEYKGDVSFTIEKYEGRPIIEVPSDRFYTNVKINDDGGYGANANSKVINFLIVDKRAPIIIRRLDHAKVYNSIDGSGTYLGFVGYLLTNLYYHDLFVPDNKVVGLYASVSTTNATNAINLVSPAVVAGGTGKSILTNLITSPAGLLYDAIYEGTDVQTVGTNVVKTATAEITIGEEFTPKAKTNQYITVVANGKVVAVSKVIANIPVGA